jgi:hypothetical protein
MPHRTRKNALATLLALATSVSAAACAGSASQPHGEPTKGVSGIPRGGPETTGPHGTVRLAFAGDMHPASGRRFAGVDRGAAAQVPGGAIHAGDVVVRAFAAIGWTWAATGRRTRTSSTSQHRKGTRHDSTALHGCR